MKKLFLIILYAVIIHAAKKSEVTQVLEGNLALPTSQQPGPLFCFGQNIVDQGDFQLFAYADSLFGKNQNYTEVFPYAIYGITDSLSLYAGVPVAAHFKANANHSSGIEDIFAQIEYAFYEKNYETYSHQATFVGNITLPSGSIVKNPPTGFGSPSFFIGFTACHADPTWYCFASLGETITTSNSSPLKFGNTFMYQGGICRNLYYVPSELIVSLIIELLGTRNKDTLQSKINRNLSGNNFYLGPSLWISTPQLIFQVGIIFPAAQQTTISQKETCFFAIEFGWKFNS